MNSKNLGNIGEACVLAELIKMGICVYQQFGDNERADYIIDVNEKQVIPMPTIMNANQSCFNDVASYDKQLIVMFEVSKLMPQSEQQGIKQLIDDNT